MTGIITASVLFIAFAVTGVAADLIGKLMEIFLLILMFSPFIVIPIAANLAEKAVTWREITYVLLAGFCGITAFTGILFLVFDLLFTLTDTGMNLIVMGAGMSITGILSLIPLLPGSRIIIAKFIPINPDSVVHAAGLVLAFILIGLSFTMMFSTDLTALFETTPDELSMTVLDILVQDSLFIVIAFIGIGIYIRRNVKDCIKRLDLTTPPAKQVIAGIILIPLFLAFGTAFEFMIAQFYPDSAAESGKIMELLLGEPTLLLAIIASICAGVSEEILFRGAIQPRFGIPFTAFLFAVVHIQYSAIWALLELFIIGIFLGILKQKTNTTTCIITHTGYDLIVFLSFLYFTQ
jgi:hypothetical protein